jgi:uncharacterized protein (UPF0210 family)
MNIRSITVLCDPGWPLQPDKLEQIGKFISTARPAFEMAGYTVQTTRLVTVPFPLLLRDQNYGEAVKLAQGLEAQANRLGFDYVSIGPALPGMPESYPVIPDVLAQTTAVFAAGVLTQSRQGIDLNAVKACAQIISRVAQLSADGFGNLRFAALANVPPGSPFLPAAYHDSVQIGFALALEAADLAVAAIETAGSLVEAQDRLVQSVENEAEKLVRVSSRLSVDFGVDFGGLDFSLAPFPERDRSIGAAIEQLGVPAVGLSGSLAAVAVLTSVLDRARYPHTGFNGVMLPVMEDVVLAQRTAEGSLSLTDLLLYSAVCGTGLDTLPLPGDTSAGQIEAILLDVAALALRLGKPLTARLMPIPGKATGESTGFDFAYFANSRIMPVSAQPLSGLLAKADLLDLHPRGKGQAGGQID